MNIVSPEINIMVKDVMVGLGLYVVLPTLIAIVLFAGVLKWEGKPLAVAVVVVALIGVLYFVLYDLEKITIDYQKNQSTHTSAFFMP